MDQMQQYVGEYFSKEWLMKNVLRFDDEQIEKMNEEMAEEKANAEPEEVPPTEEPEAKQQSQHTINLKVAK
jgi:hypothetical protein